MRTKTIAEQAFICQLVENTRKLILNDSICLKEKLHFIQVAIDENSRKLLILRRAKVNATKPENIERIERFITLRKQAMAYLGETAKFLEQDTSTRLTLRQRPRFFAYPSWELSKPKPPSEPEIKFMEFSS